MTLSLLAALVASASANAASFSSSAVTAPASGSQLFYNGDAGSGAVTVRGTVTGPSATAKGDLLCYSRADSDSGTAKGEGGPLATAVNVASGSFALAVSLAPIAGKACRLAMVPSGTAPLSAAAAPFAGPSITVDSQFSHSRAGNLFGYDVEAGTVGYSYDLESLGECPVLSSFITDPVSLTSFSVFAGNACLLGSSGIAPNQHTRSALQVDGLNAYPPGAIGPGAPGLPAPLADLTARAGFEPLSYSTDWSANHDAVTITEYDIPTVCDPPGSYPPTTSSCPSLHDSGISIAQTTQTLNGGQIIRVTQRVSSTDGRAHTYDALISQSASAPAPGQQPGFEFPGQTSFAGHGAPDAFAAFPAGPSSIVVLGDSTAAPSGLNPIGGITYNRAPRSADFVTPAGSSTATFLMHYTDQIPATGYVVYDWSFEQASSGSGLSQLEQSERARWGVPTVLIAHPRNRSTTRRRQTSITGSVSDPVGIASLTVAGQAVTLGAGGSFASPVTLVPGPNTIAVQATNFAGNATRAIVTVTYKPLPCVVPRLRGKTIATARLVLQARDCRAGRIVRVRSKAVRKGHVIDTSPKPGTQHRPFYKVRIFVSRGR
jgi:hypothetical protein